MIRPVPTPSRSAVAALLAVLLTATVTASAAAQAPIRVRYSTRALAMGGTTLLSAGPIEAGYFNPGALTQSKGFHLYIPMIQIGGTSDYLELANFLIDNSEKFSPTGFMALTQPQQVAFLNDLGDYTGKWQTLNIDPMIGVQIGSLSLSGYMVSQLRMRPDPVVLTPLPSLPTVRVQAAADLVLNGALGLQFGPFLHGGIGVRYLRRQQSDIITIDSDDMEDLGSLTTKLVDEKNWVGDPLTAFQVDAGGMLTLTKAFAVGGVIRGLVSGSNDKDVKWEPEVSAGVRLKPLELLMGLPLVIIRDITLEADLRDFFNVRGEDYLEKLQFGAEVKLPLIALRAGYLNGQLSYGVGVHVLVVDLAAAVSTVQQITPLGWEDKRLFTVSVGIGW